MEVTLEPLSAAHLDGVAALWGDRRVIRYTAVPAPCGREASAARLEALFKCQAGLRSPVLFAVLDRGRFCGIAGCPPVDAQRAVFGLFYQLLPDAWGAGAGTAAAGLALARLEEAYPGAEVLADAAAANSASVRILEKLGFHLTAVRPGAFEKDGASGDIRAYALRLGKKKEERP